MTPPRSRTAHRSVALLGALLLPLGLAACTGSETDDDVEDTTARPASVALGATAASGEAAAEPLSATLGVVVTLRSRRGEGSDQRFGAAGAQLAAYRMSLGEAEVDLEVVDDDGTTAGARDAVASLVEAGVAGIVVASQGEHLSEALADAADAGVPVLLPYDRRDTLPDGVWQTGPSASAVDAALLEALRADGHESPYVVTADGLEVDGVGSADGATYRPGRAGQVVRRALDALDTGSADAVVVAGSASTQADLVARFAGVGADTAVPLYLSPEALSPAFPRALVDEADALVGGLVSVGATVPPRSSPPCAWPTRTPT